jgi:hypothetical protein
MAYKVVTTHEKDGFLLYLSCAQVDKTCGVCLWIENEPWLEVDLTMPLVVLVLLTIWTSMIVL